MTRRSKDSDLRVGGLSVAARFTLFMTLALAPILVASGFVLYRNSSKITSNVLQETLVSGVRLRASEDAQAVELTRARILAEHYRDEYLALRDRNAERKKSADEAGKAALDAETERAKLVADEYLASMRAAAAKMQENPLWQTTSDAAQSTGAGDVKIAKVTYGKEKLPGVVYQFGRDTTTNLVVPDTADVAGRGLLGLIVSSTLLVMLVAVVVAAWVGRQVGAPIEEIVGDIRQISTGDLEHRTRVKAGGEVALLARTIDRMARSLGDAQETELELQMREREVALATEVRESLLADTLPKIPGYELGVMHLVSEEMGGDFHDFIQIGDGRVGLLVCDVSGQGVPGTLVGATARAYLRAELSRGGDVRQALLSVNRYLAHDVRRGMYVTALYALVDPKRATASVVCAGHKIPLVRFSGADGKVRLVQPEGIALAFDKGPIFDRALQVQEVPLREGDRLVLANTGVVEIVDPAGKELGEKDFYAKVMRHAASSRAEFLESMRGVLLGYAGGEALPRDISLITIART